ncbi:PilZ domain-containing protein [Breznakiellaceae bacterium SP9]
MATPIKRIEKDFLLKVLYDEQIPLMYLQNRSEYILFVEKPTKGEVFLKSNRPITGLKPRKKLDLIFDYRNQVISFTVEISSVRDEHIITLTPDYLYKNLERSYYRVAIPSDLQVRLMFRGDRYALTYPRVQDFEPVDFNNSMKEFDPKNLRGLVTQMENWIKGFANGYKLVIFKGSKPTTIEERIVAETGKSFYIPSTLTPFPAEDPFPKKRIVTAEIFMRYLETTGIDLAYVSEVVNRFLKNKRDAGFLSDVWVPVLFHEYVVGYIHAWSTKEGKLPFDFSMLDMLYRFSKILAFSLKINGYFDEGRLKNEPFDGKVVDISATGLLFAYPHSRLSAALLLDSELQIKIKAAKRTINANAKIVRRYKDNTMDYFGCRFLDMEPENMRFLFEYIYGKHFTDSDAAFITGSV